MVEQYHDYSNFPAEVKYSPNDDMVDGRVHWGAGMNRVEALSNDSSISRLSHSSGNYWSPPTSPVNMSYPRGYEDNAPTPQQQYESSYGFYQQTENARHTPSSLGWGKPTELVKLYRFIVPSKGKLPYFELLEPYTATHETPDRVYLDECK